MIQTEEKEKPGINAVIHSCEMMVTDPADEECVVRCLIVAHLQCETCTAWVCGSEELEHAIFCAKCDGVFCPEHFEAHRLSKDCEQRIA